MKNISPTLQQILLDFDFDARQTILATLTKHPELLPIFIKNFTDKKNAAVQGDASSLQTIVNQEEDYLQTVSNFV